MYVYIYIITVSLPKLELGISVSINSEAKCYSHISVTSVDMEEALKSVKQGPHSMLMMNLCWAKCVPNIDICTHI